MPAVYFLKLKTKMENNNLLQNTFLKQFNQSDSIAYDQKYISSPRDFNFQLLDNAYRNMGKVYAKIKIAIETNKCQSEYCSIELAQLKRLEEAPQSSLDFLSLLMSQLMITEEDNFDLNNDFRYKVANSLMNGRPGFSKTDGYNVSLTLLENGSQEIYFTGPAFMESVPDPYDSRFSIQLENPLIINSVSLQALIDSETMLIASTPAIDKEMDILLTEIGLFAQEMISEDGKLNSQAKISEEFILKNSDGSFDYEIIDLGDGKGKNILKFNMEKISQKINPFVNAEVEGLMSSEQMAVAAWNVYISKLTNDDSWSYEFDLPLQQDKKVLFQTKYKEYFMENYLKQFITNQAPIVEEDIAVFDLAQAKQADAQKFLDDNNLN